MNDSTQNQEIVPTEQGPGHPTLVTKEARSSALGGGTLMTCVACICGTILMLGVLNTVNHTEDKIAEISDEIASKPFKFLEYAIDRIFSPKVNETITITTKEGKRVAELNAYAKEYVGEYTYETTWLGSTKQLCYKQKYEVKYGILLNSLRLDYDSSTFNYEANEANIIITSITPVGKPYIRGDDGLWNKITDAERVKTEVRALKCAKLEAEYNYAAKRAAFEGLVDILNQFAEENHANFRYRLD